MSLAVFAVFETVVSCLYASAPLLATLKYAAFFVFFFAGVPVLIIGVCGGIPLFLLLQNRPTRVARSLFLGSGIVAGMVVVPAVWYHIWHSFGILFVLIGAAAGGIGAYTFWKVAGDIRSTSNG
jgi:hypothetical protein